MTILCPACRKPNERRAKFCSHCGFDLVLNNPGPRYFITRVIKAGGQGAVYEGAGEDNKVYAIKEMLDDFSDPAERQAAVERFQAEAKLLGSLNHPRIPRIYASFNDEGRHYLVMDFVRGEDLEDIVEREGAQPEARVLDWADQICDVLEHLHASGLIYRDCKPSNVMLDAQDGRIKMIDFGIAKLFQPHSQGTQIGTPGYAPPEQYQGLATPVSDVYALGATLHHLLTGRDPQQHAPFNFPAVRDLRPQVSQRTSDAIVRALQMKAEDRFPSIRAFREALCPPAPAPAATPRSVAAAPAVTARQVPAQPATVATPTPAPAPPSVVAPPAAPAVAGATATPPAAVPNPRGRLSTRMVFVTLGVIASLMIAGSILLFGALNPVLPWASPTATAQSFSKQPFTAEDMTLILVANLNDTAVQNAFIRAYLELARADCACAAQLDPNEPIVFLTPPERLADEPQGTRYRASIQGIILVPIP